MDIYSEFIRLDRLAASYTYLEKRRLLDEHLYSKEEWLLNLHNHLTWRSYVPHVDSAADSVVLIAIEKALRRKGIKPEEADAETQKIIDDLTLI